MTTNTAELINALPPQWQCVPLKQYFRFGKGLPITKADLVDNGEKVISYGQVHAKYNTGVHIDDKLIRYVSPDYLETNKSSLCSKGDFIFADTSEDIEGCGNAVYVDSDTHVFAGYHTIILRSEENNKFLAYLFLSDGWRSQIRQRVQGIKVFSISQKILSQCQIWLPPAIEQQAIADYLDDRCSKIDEIIAEATASIEEYKKLKQTVIFEAVTKGLDKNVTMKGSEILWAKQIPDSWDVVKVAWLYSVELGKMLDGKRITGVRLKPYLRNADVQWNGINTNNLPEMDFTEDDDERYSVKSGDLLVCEGGDIGKSFIAPEDFPKGIYYQKALHRVRAFDGDIDSLKWLRYILYVMSKYSFFNVLSGEKATIQHLPGVTFNQLRFPMPKQGEKESIIKFLDNKIPEYDILISEKQSLIEDLQAYKKSLIYEVVTGKRRVV